MVRPGGASLTARLYYSSDSGAGSSGAPCLSQNFELVAMHLSRSRFAGAAVPALGFGVPVAAIAADLEDKARGRDPTRLRLERWRGASGGAKWRRLGAFRRKLIHLTLRAAEDRVSKWAPTRTRKHASRRSLRSLLGEGLLYAELGDSAFIRQPAGGACRGSNSFFACTCERLHNIASVSITCRTPPASA
jgi:hypothetical protein